MAKKKNEKSLSFEASLAKLEAIVAQLEEGGLGLTESLGRYEEGIGHLKRCHLALQNAERKIELMTGVDSQGAPRTRLFDDEPTSDELF